MKIILTQEVSGLGSAGDVVVVKDGYARNYLVPRGVAIRWSRGAETTVESMRKAKSARSSRDAAHVAEIKGKLEAATVSVLARVGADDRLYGAVTTTEIAEALTAASGENIDKRSIAIANPIKSLGSHVVSVKIADDVSAIVSVDVVKS